MSLFFRKSPDTFDYTLIRTCKHCNNSFSGRFCNICGQKVIEKSDRTILSLAEQLLSAITFMEGKFWNSFKTMIFSPGKLSSDISAGVQVPYMTLMALFFLANFLYFLFPYFDTFNSSLYSQFYQQEFSGIVQSMVKNHINTTKIDIKDYTILYNEKSENLSKLLLILLVFIISIPLLLLNLRKKKLYHDHLLASFEFNAFLLFINSFLLPHIINIVVKYTKIWFGLDWSFILTDAYFSWLSQILFLYFFFWIHKRFYADSTLVSLLKGVVMSYIVVYSWKLYRLILFLITFWSI